MDLRIWIKGIAAAAISGGANGVVTGFAAIGIDPNHFNLKPASRTRWPSAAPAPRSAPCSASRCICASHRYLSD